jgi:hypothetical protein
VTPRLDITWPTALVCVAAIAGTVTVLVTHSLPPEWAHTLEGAWVGGLGAWMLKPPIKFGPDPERKAENDDG